MNSMERVLATLGGKPLDRRAVAPILSRYGARLTDCPLDQYYTDPAAYARGQSAVLETFQPDVLFSPFNFPAIGLAFGSELHLFADQEPNVRRPAIQSVEEWDKFVLPDPDTNPHLLFFREAISRMASETRGRVPVAAVLPPPIDLPILMMGLETWLETVLFDVDRAQQIVERMTPFFVHLANGLFEDGAALLALPCAFTSPAIVTRKIAATFGRPALKMALAQVKGPVILHHIGAPILAHLDVMTGLPSTVAFALDHLDNLAQARRLVGPEAVLLGGPCGPNLGRMTTAQVEKECRVILEDRQADAHFILFTSGADIPLDTLPENIHAIRKAAESYGRIDP
jgi:uroporphyrinogen decarboxylase